MHDDSTAPPTDDDAPAAPPEPDAGDAEDTAHADPANANGDGEAPAEERQLTSYTVYVDPAQFAPAELDTFNVETAEGGNALLELGEFDAWDRGRAVGLYVEQLEKQANEDSLPAEGIEMLLWSKITAGDQVRFRAPHARALTEVPVQDKIERKRSIG